MSSPTTPTTLPHHSDLTNARHLIAQHSPHIRYAPTLGWLHYDGQRWQPDPDTLHLTHLATQTLETLAADALALPEDQSRHAAAILTHVHRSLRPARINALLHLASTDPTIRIPHTALDAHPHLLNVANGTLNLHTGELQPHNPADLLTRLAPFAYHPHTASPTWDAFLEQITDHNPDLLTYLQHAIGYTLCATPAEGIVFLLHGTGRNGKHTFLTAISHALGDYADTVPLTTFTRPPSSGPYARTLATTLPATRLLTTTSTSPKQKLDLPTLTRLTATDPITLPAARTTHTFQPTFVTWLSASSLPMIPDALPASWDRIKRIPFPVSFSGHHNPHLAAHLRAAAPAILAWALTGALHYLQHGLHEPELIRQSTADYRDHQDPIADFLLDCCTLNPDATVKAHELYLVYHRWSRARNERPRTETAFLLDLQIRGYRRERKNSGKIYHGLTLLPSSSSTHPMPTVPGSLNTQNPSTLLNTPVPGSSTPAHLVAPSSTLSNTPSSYILSVPSSSQSTDLVTPSQTPSNDPIPSVPLVPGSSTLSTKMLTFSNGTTPFVPAVPGSSTPTHLLTPILTGLSAKKDRDGHQSRSAVGDSSPRRRDHTCGISTPARANADPFQPPPHLADALLTLSNDLLSVPPVPGSSHPTHLSTHPPILSAAAPQPELPSSPTLHTFAIFATPTNPPTLPKTLTIHTPSLPTVPGSPPPPDSFTPPPHHNNQEPAHNDQNDQNPPELVAISSPSPKITTRPPSSPTVPGLSKPPKFPTRPWLM